MVIDTSAVLAVLLREPSREALIVATDGVALVAAPSLPWEVGNALIAGVRKNRLSLGDAQRAWKDYTDIPLRFSDIDVARALDGAVNVGLYAYDGYVLETARSEALPLLTLDKPLARAAAKLGVSLVWQL